MQEPPARNARQFEVSRSNLRQWRWQEGPVPQEGQLAAGQVALRIERFALTANNITYALLGDRLGYWSFFPAENGWGRIPAWGFATVTASRHADVPPGERIFGYVPMANHALMQPGAVRPGHFAEASPHRAQLNPVYNHYLRLGSALAPDAQRDAPVALLRPLVMTALLLHAHFAEQRLFGAARVVLASGSSKTALASAFLLARNGPPWPEVVALTSPRNAELCGRARCYDRVLAYDQLTTLSTGTPTAFVDMAGNAQVRAAVHAHLAADLTYSGQVGWTHWEQDAAAGPLPGIAPVFFSSLEHIARRNREWGAAGFETRLDQAWRAFLPATESWLRIVHGAGVDAVQAAYRSVLEGQARPEEGLVLSL